MESPSRALALPLPLPLPLQQHLSATLPDSDSEFQFWNIAPNNSEPISTTLHSADELFSDGFLLPLHSLRNPRSPPCSSECLPEPSALITSDVPSNRSNPILGASKRWMEIFKRSEKKLSNDVSNTSSGNDVEENKREKMGKKKDKQRHSNGSVSTELNINIWPFSRSRSAGNNSNRSNKPATSNRKVSSAPCSRSNSSGESKSLRRSWPNSPGRAGVHLGRASPVWQVKRSVPGNRTIPVGVGGGKGKVVSKVNVPGCIGYQERTGNGSDGNYTVVGGGENGGGGGKIGGGNGNLFSFRGLFSKKNDTICTV